MLMGVVRKVLIVKDEFSKIVNAGSSELVL
jgi:hypothetical protein